ncbi:MAG: HEAT repeat domain-containing protein [Dethiobacter sp.]|jgi:epoxyqueuosine reductase|nr:HEAT repeat domain-containing protein [Dethiobacter sp.]
MATVSEEIKEYAISIGYDLAGITTASPFTEFAEILMQRSENYSWTISSPLKLLEVANPQNILSSAKSVIVCITDYYKLNFPESLTGKIGKAYQYQYELAQSKEFGTRVKKMINYLQEAGFQVASRPELPARRAAQRAGLVTFGNNTFVYNENMGSYLSIICFVVDKELDYDTPSEGIVCPDNCSRCLKACPTGALCEPLHINPLKCLAFNSYATEVMFGREWEIPEEIREKMGTWIFGCDICQDVCPKNQKKLKTSQPESIYLQELGADFDLKRVLNMDEEYFQRLRRLTYYIWHKKYLQRNAAIALGNLKDVTAIPDLEKALNDPEEMVRASAAWALEKIKC